ncbi:MAG: winged helix DNA-binding domain-containing protein, partial [Treponema sp.]|nr:winged helix DNA-binding domain-containing protein [Treponema sp.]
YCRSEDERIFGLIRKKELAPAKNRCEFIAPLDNMMWDRNLIKAIWNFDYKWEIYTPQAERKFGYYVLPLLYGENFIGRIEPAFDKKTKKLEVKNLWYEEGIKRTKDIKEKVEAAVKKFEAFCKS